MYGQEVPVQHDETRSDSVTIASQLQCFVFKLHNGLRRLVLVPISTAIFSDLLTSLCFPRIFKNVKQSRYTSFTKSYLGIKSLTL